MAALRGRGLRGGDRRLFASQLFGHVRGAFTGAVRDMSGAFRAADGGTLFLDEVSELDPACQAKLLRVLQQCAVTPVGGHDEVPVDVRVVAASNRDLAAEAASGRFRADLFYRLNVIAIEAVPLRARREDIPLLAAHFLEEIAAIEREPPRRLTPAASAELAAYAWPGNVRELRNVIEWSLAFAEGATVDVALIAAALASCRISVQGDGPPLHQPAEPADVPQLSSPADEAAGEERMAVYRMQTVAEAERVQIITALQNADYNQSRAAAMLGLTRQQLRRRMERHFADSLPARRGRPQSQKQQRQRAA